MRPFDREKLLHAIVFFVQKTRACHKMKLFKLLYFLDFAIFRQTGRSTTGLLYLAFPMGPVPQPLYRELANPPADMKKALTLFTAADDPDSNSALNIIPRIAFDESRFTKRELAEMRRLAEIYVDATSEMMSLASHERGGPWHRVYEVEKRPRAPIPYELILDDREDSVTKDQADEMALEARGVAGLFK